MPQINRKENKKFSLRYKVIKEKSYQKYFKLEALFHVLCSGSMTLEAALILPIFLFTMVMILFLFWMMQIQYIVGNSLAKAVAESSLISGISEKEAESLTKAAFYKELIIQKCPLSKIELGIGGFSWKNTKVDMEYINTKVTYYIKFPIRFFGKRKMKLSDGCCMHRWTGNYAMEAGDKKQEWVYITPTNSVYHVNRECTHLKISIISMPSIKLKKELKKYSPCGHCVNGKKISSIVYLTNEGECYHIKIDCSALKRTIYMIPKEQVNGKRPCLRCGGK